jgi:hypothetical protein
MKQLRGGAIASCITKVGGVGVAICCDCGHISAVEMTLGETADLIALLQSNLAIAARVRALPVPFIHEEGAA